MCENSPWPWCPGPTCSRRTCSPWCDSTGTPLRGETAAARTTPTDQIQISTYETLTGTKAEQRIWRGVGEGGGDEGRPRRGAKVATRARRAARPVSCKALIAAPRGCG